MKSLFIKIADLFKKTDVVVSIDAIESVRDESSHETATCITTKNGNEIWTATPIQQIVAEIPDISDLVLGEIGV